MTIFLCNPQKLYALFFENPKIQPAWWLLSSCFYGNSCCFCLLGFTLLLVTLLLLTLLLFVLFPI
jgi:hypothetical protein